VKELAMGFRVATSISPVALALTVAIGCSGATGDPLAVPDSPDGTVRVVLDGLAAHHPEVVWRALPLSYQQDVTELARTFADSVDPVVFDRAVAVARKSAVVLQSKKDLILGSESVSRAQLDPASLDAFWEASAHMVDAVLASEVADLRTLREIDVEAWLAGTGSVLMDQASVLPAENEEMESFAQRVAAFEHADVELVSEDGDSAVVRIVDADETPTELELVRVEGRWVPIELASQWPETIAETEAKIRALGGDDDAAAQLRVQLLFGIGIVEGFVDEIDRMESSDELDGLFGGIVGNVMAMQG